MFDTVVYCFTVKILILLFIHFEVNSEILPEISLTLCCLGITLGFFVKRSDLAREEIKAFLGLYPVIEGQAFFLKKISLILVWIKSTCKGNPTMNY